MKNLIILLSALLVIGTCQANISEPGVSYLTGEKTVTVGATVKFVYFPENGYQIIAPLGNIRATFPTRNSLVLNTKPATPNMSTPITYSGTQTNTTKFTVKQQIGLMSATGSQVTVNIKTYNDL